jgi:hypothetical protein
MSGDSTPALTRRASVLALGAIIRRHVVGSVIRHEGELARGFNRH